MKVSHRIVVNLSEEDIAEAISQYLALKHIVGKVEKHEIKYNISKTGEQEDLIEHSHDTLKFNGCTVTVNTEQEVK